MNTKPQLRREIEALRKTLEPGEIETMSSKIIANTEKLEPFHSAKIVALYKAIPGEVNLDALFQTCWNLGKTTCIPIFNAISKIYEMAIVSKETDYKTGHYGIKEPSSPTLTPIKSIDLIAVPGMAFDPHGNRLGRGGGYYDRLLNGFSGFSVAVAFDFQILNQIPCDAHDRPVQAIVTPSEIINVLNER
jgi:5-formyltetrahydrofolate cyclo-ligase